MSRLSNGGKKPTSLTAGDVLQKMWDCVRMNNGIMVSHRLFEVLSEYLYGFSALGVAESAVNENADIGSGRYSSFSLQGKNG